MIFFFKQDKIWRKERMCLFSLFKKSSDWNEHISHVKITLMNYIGIFSWTLSIRDMKSLYLNVFTHFTRTPNKIQLCVLKSCRFLLMFHAGAHLNQHPTHPPMPLSTSSRFHEIEMLLWVVNTACCYCHGLGLLYKFN